MRDIAWLDLLRDTQLVALVREAMSNNLDLREAQSRVREYRAQLGAARVSQLPTISTTGTTSHNKVAFGPTVVGYDAVRVTGDLSWELDFWGKARKQVDAAAYDLAARDAEVRSTMLSLVGDIATAYLRLRELDESVHISDQTLMSRRSTLDLARRRFQQGVTSELDVFQFEADLAESAARVADFTRQRTEVENQLSQLLGRAPGSIPRGRALDDVVQALIVPDSLPGELIARRPDVVAAQRALQASLSRVGVAAASRLPTISVTGQYGTQRPDFSRLFARQNELYTTQLGVTIPLFPFIALRDQQRAASARAEQAQARYRQKVLAGLRESNDALAGVHLHRDQLAAQRTQMRALERAFTLADQRYRSGVSSYLEVLDAQRRLFTAQLSFVQAERQYLVATVDLYKALGGGWDAGR
ncbi:MAG: efflux transporter outer membrane subunit [Proteobacteria bacterium]|nr:efflux transporter outer membrane subunit [Burkholderiales bacterium]